MSTEENRKLMQHLLAAAAAGDRAPYLAHLAENATMRVTGRNSWSRTFSGKQEILRDLYGYLHTLLDESRRTVPIRFIADGDHVAVEGRGEMMTRNGVRYDNEYCLVYRLEQGMIVEIREYLDSALCESVLGKYPRG